MGETVFDISKGDYFEILDKDLAIQVFRPLEELKNSCTKICFVHHIFGVEAALVAKRALMGVQTTLRDVQLAHIVSGKPLDEALEVMSIFSSALEGCTLRSLTLDIGKSGEKGVKAFAPLLTSQKTLEKLEFVLSNISGEAARAICELLPSFETIKSLHFSYTEAGDDAAQIISKLVKKCISLESFVFSGNYIGIHGAMALVEALGRCSRLKSLCLAVNMFGEAGGVALSRVISGHLGLTEVNLGYMNLQDKGVIAIARSLKDTAPYLRFLNVGANCITPKAAPALAECLAVKKLLTGFYARDNGLEDYGSIAICKAILEGHEELKELDLSANAMTITGAKAAAEAVANKPDFSWLSIYGNLINEKGIETIKDVVRKGTNGKSESVLGRMLDSDKMMLNVVEYMDGYKREEEGFTDSESEGLTDSDTEVEEKLWHEDL